VTRPTPGTEGGEKAVELLIGDAAPVVLRRDEIDRVVEALGRLGSEPAARVGDDIAALRLAGGSIRLLPTGPEREAVRIALAGADRGDPLSPALRRLAELCGTSDVVT